jgi:hypothetical protein
MSVRGRLFWLTKSQLIIDESSRDSGCVIRNQDAVRAVWLFADPEPFSAVTRHREDTETYEGFRVLG